MWPFLPQPMLLAGTVLCRVGQRGGAALALQVSAALGNEPQERCSEQNSALAKGLQGAGTFICWGFTDAVWRHAFLSLLTEGQPL